MQNISLPMKFNLIENNKSNLQKCELWIMREGLNSNGSSFDLESMGKAKESLQNIPILAYVKKREDGENDFDEHNMEYHFETDEEGNLKIKEYYLEVPIGVIPETNNYRLEKVNGHMWVVADGYIWKSYSNEGYEILKRDEEKSVSMEISVNKGEFDKNIYHIKDYVYQGVTILGSDVAPGISGAKIKMEFSNNDNTEFFNAVKELNKMLKDELQSEVNQVSKENLEFEEIKKKIVDEEDVSTQKLPMEEDLPGEEDSLSPDGLEEESELEKPNQVDEEIDKGIEYDPEKDGQEPLETSLEEDMTTSEVASGEEVIEEETSEEDSNEEDASEEFSASTQNVVGYINEALSKVTYDEEWCGEQFTFLKYYFEDLLLDSGVAVLYDAEDFKYVGVTYSIEGDNVLLDFDSAKEYVPTWKEREVNQNPRHGIVSAFKKEINEKVNTVISKFKEENEELKKFKDEVETSNLKEELNEMASEFTSLGEDETQKVIDKVLNKELDKKDFKKELFAIVGMKAMSELSLAFNSKKTKLRVPIAQEVQDEDPYGGLIKK